MKKTKIFALALVFMMVVSLFTTVSAFATEGDTTTTADTSTTTTTTTPAAPVGFSKQQIVKYSVSNPNVKFSLPGEFACITIDSEQTAISNFGVSKEEFISYGYVAYAICDESYSYCYITRSQDEYTKYIKDYKKLSDEEIAAMVTAKASEFDSSTYTLMYESVDSVELGGRTFIKGISSSNTSSAEVTVVEYTTVVGGYEYVISCIYPKNLDQDSVDNFINAIETIKISGGLNIAEIIPYLALAIGLISLVLSIVLFTKANAVQSEIGAYPYEETTEDEEYFGEEAQEAIEQTEEVVEEAAEVAEEVEEMAEETAENIEQE